MTLYAAIRNQSGDKFPQGRLMSEYQQGKLELKKSLACKFIWFCYIFFYQENMKTRYR